ncbi:MAG: ABC transporter substrate-binding protein, partial [Dehalococcoidia bacterium]|nr:ABC transporter substrate-binding protein [Dehalococcoidia bacterium]
DVGGGAMSAALFNAIKRDVPLKVVADRGWVPPDRGGGAALVARKELVQSGQLKSFSDLKGMTLASNAEASAGDLGIMRAVELGKLTPQDVKIVRIPFPEMMAAFASKSIDVSYEVEPFVTMGTDQGLTVPWKPLNEVVPNQQVGVWLYGPRFMKDKAEAAKRTMVALMKGVRDYNDAFVKNKGKAEVVAILAKYTSVKDVPLYDRMDPAVLSPDGQLLLKDLMDQQDWYLSKGYRKEKVSLQDLVDSQYVDYALNRLGKYQ